MLLFDAKTLRYSATSAPLRLLLHPPLHNEMLADTFHIKRSTKHHEAKCLIESFGVRTRIAPQQIRLLCLQVLDGEPDQLSSCPLPTEIRMGRHSAKTVLLPTFQRFVLLTKERADTNEMFADEYAQVETVRISVVRIVAIFDGLMGA